MKLKITTPEGSGFKRGSVAQISLDSVDVSKYVRRVVLTVDAEDAISAEVSFYLTGVDVDVPAVILCEAET